MKLKNAKCLFIDLELDSECPSPSAQLFGSFSSCSPRYKKSHGLFLLDPKSSNDSTSGLSDQSELSCNSSNAGDGGISMSHVQHPTPESTTEADEDSTSSSPQLQRRRRMLHRELKSLPRFSISKDVNELILKIVTSSKP